jgi:predicted MFS family arabinose efflux permease
MTTPNISKLDKKYLTTAWLTMYVIGSDLFIISPLLPHIASDLNISNNQSGLLVSIFAIAYAIASPLFGAASDKYGRKNMIVWGLCIFTIANFLTAYSTNFIFMLFSRLLAGISASSVAPSVYAIIRDQAPIDNCGRWLSIAGFGLLSALWTSAPFGAIMVNIVSWNKVFFILAIHECVKFVS